MLISKARECRVCYQPQPLLAKRQKGKGKSNNKAGQSPLTEYWNAQYHMDFAMSKEDTEHLEFNK
eukprot:3648285-Heterocapsa_arctica.AAC.1